MTGDRMDSNRTTLQYYVPQAYLWTFSSGKGKNPKIFGSSPI